MNPAQCSAIDGFVDQGYAVVSQLPAAGELIGFELFSSQKGLGTIEDLIVLGGEPYFLVDTRHWTFGEQRLVPAAGVRCLDPGRRTAVSSVGVEVIRAAPDFNPFRLNDRRYSTAVQDHYRANQRIPSPGTGPLIGDADPPSIDTAGSQFRGRRR